ncbi:3-oxoadipate enol-lactonase [Neotabrizicola sp. VNH66]|uniref:3-oxoadipate enol-lactonase n=1 Tax=Neotabrizicola sp. VNH66 TaxID=3400918 RepID=UPI003C0C4F77
MPALLRPWGRMHYRIDGPDDGPELVFANSLGTDLRLWDDVVQLLPEFRCIRFDKPGHGLSDGAAAVTIDSLAEDAAALIGRLARGPVVLVGLSIGGMIAQAVALRHPGLLRGLVLSNTAAKMGTAEGWSDRIAAIRAGGLESIADAVMDRWFAAEFRAGPDLAIWRNMMVRTPAAGYIAACEALAAADLTGALAGLRLPVMVIAGEEDRASPPDLVAGLAAAIPGARLHRLAGTGHIPPAEAAGPMAGLLRSFAGILAPLEAVDG